MTTTALLPVASVPTVEPVRYRLATDEDGPAIGALFKAADYGDLGVDWTTARVGAWWYLAERDGAVVGAIHFCASHPFGLIGDCVVHPSVRAREDDGPAAVGDVGAVTRLLYARALTALRDAGVPVAIGATAKPGMKRLLTRYGAESLGATELFAKGLV